MLAVDDIHTYYGESYVLQGTSIHVDAGEVVAVLGRNGVGKTTLVRSVTGLTPPRRGRIAFKDREITRWPAHRIARNGIGVVPQGRHVFPSLSVRENLSVAARRRAGSTWTLERIVEVFPVLRERFAQGAGTLSGGEQQMLAAARALLTNPDLLLMDEPSEGLAPMIVREIGRIIEALKASGASVLLIEQQVAFALRHADRIYIMSKGRIVHHARPEDLSADAEIQARYLGIT